MENLPPPPIPFQFPETNSKARLSLILGVGSLLLGRIAYFVISFVINLAITRSARAGITAVIPLIVLLVFVGLGLAAVIIGWVGWTEIKRSMGRSTGKWLAVGGIVTGIMSMGLMIPTIFMFVVALFAPTSGRGIPSPLF